MAESLALNELDKIFSVKAFNWNAPISNFSTTILRGEININPFASRVILDGFNSIIQEFDVELSIAKEVKHEEDKLFLKGNDYHLNSHNPSCRDIITHIMSNPIYSFYILQLKPLLIKDFHNDAELRVKIIDHVTFILKNVCKGYDFSKRYSTLIEYERFYVMHKSYFNKKYPIPIKWMMVKNGSSELEDDAIFTIANFEKIRTRIIEFESIGIGPWDTLSYVCNRQMIITKLEEEFNEIKTPNWIRTIEDRILSIKVKAGLVESMAGLNNYFKDGYLYAIRGQSPILIELEYSRGWEIGPDLSSNLESLLNGFASAFHLEFIEEKLKRMDDQSANKEERSKPFVILNWNGRNNQLYDVLRQLKMAGLILNNYSDLALFLKLNVNKFHETAQITIQKELERGKRPPKNRRIDLELSEEED